MPNLLIKKRKSLPKNATSLSKTKLNGISYGYSVQLSLKLYCCLRETMNEESVLKDYCLPKSHHCLQKDSAAYADDSLTNKDDEFPHSAQM